MLSGDTSVAQGRQGAFFQMLCCFAPHWQRIDVICPRASGSESRTVHGNVFVYPSPWHKTLQLFYILQMGRQLLLERQYDLIVSHDYGFFYNGAGAWWLSRSYKIPYVSEILHVEGYPRAASLLHLIYRLLAMLYIKWVWRHAVAIRAINQIEIPELLRRLGVPAHKILVLPAMYIDFEVFHPMLEEPKQYDVLFIGRLAPNKGVLTIVDAVSRVKQTHPEVRLCILGEGPLDAAVKKRIESLALQDNVTIISHLPSAEAVARLHNQSKILVCASTAEGGPRVTVEAMACGTPVITTPVGMMCELIQDGVNGLLFHWDPNELAQKIRSLLDDESLRQRLGEAGRASVQEYRADRVIEQYARGYQQLLERLTEPR